MAKCYLIDIFEKRAMSHTSYFILATHSSLPKWRACARPHSGLCARAPAQLEWESFAHQCFFLSSLGLSGRHQR